MSLSPIALPLAIEWVLLVTSLVPLVAPGRGNNAPNIAIFSMFAALSSAVVALLLAVTVALQSLFNLWQHLVQIPASQHNPGHLVPALLLAAAPWALLAGAGISIALINQRLEPAVVAARAAHPQIVATLTPGGTAAGIQYSTIATPAVLSFTTRANGRPTIVVSSGALTALTQGELEAVLWHERAHLRGHHNALKTTAALLAQLTPRIAASLVLVNELERLCEAAADRYALKHTSHQLLLAARAKF